jgi:hypothetical protein
MKYSLILLFFSLLSCFPSYSQDQFFYYNQYAPYFREAYTLYPGIPAGMLEAIAADRSHIRHLQPDEEAASCSGMPLSYGVMGLVEDGKGYFYTNISEVETWSGYSREDIKKDPRINILAYAAAYEYLRKGLGIRSLQPADHVPILKELSELPMKSGNYGTFPVDAQIYNVLNWLNNPGFQQLLQLPDYNIDLPGIFGEENYRVLSASKILLDGDKVTNEVGEEYRSPQSGPCYDSPGVLWVESPNYSSRAGTAVSAVTVHTTQGSYAGAISWFQSTVSQVSAHYVIRSSDGQVTQMVCEADKGWHVGSENAYTIGIEHEGYIADASWYTTAMYNASAAIVRDIINSGYGINPLRTYHGPGCNGSTAACGLGACTKIKGHQQFPNQSHTDPGQYWNWDLYYNLINNAPTVTVQTAFSGTVYDPGGVAGNYADDIRQVVRIAPTGAGTISLTINSFNTELNYDYLYIYDGSTYTAPLIGRYSGTSIPTLIQSSGNTLLLDFRTDCSTTAPGFSISWNATVPDITAPVTSVVVPDWATTDFIATFTDTDNAGGSGIHKAYYHVSDYDGARWSSNTSRGFFNDEFSGTGLSNDWTVMGGNWSLLSGQLQQTDETNANTSIYAPLTQNLSNVYVYHWQGKITGSGTNKRAGLHFFCNSPTLPNRGISYFIYMREDDNKVQLYEVDATDTYTLQQDIPFTINTNQSYDYKVIYDRISGKIEVYINNVLVTSWTDTTPISNGSAVSFRSGNCKWTVDNFRVYRSRTTTPLVGIGNATADIRFQNVNPGTPAGTIRSLVRDNAGNLSAVVAVTVMTDWTIPVSPVINSETITYNAATAKYTVTLGWANASDSHSGITGYWVKIGTTPGGSDILPATNVGNVNSTTFDNLVLAPGTACYQTLTAINGAGLVSDEVHSTGVITGCAAPVNLLVTNINSTSAKLHWTAVSDKKIYQLRIRPVGANIYTLYNVKTGNSKTMNNLLPGTTYEWSVRTKCLSGVLTAFSPSGYFSTLLTDLTSTGYEINEPAANHQNLNISAIPNPVVQDQTQIVFSHYVNNALMTVTGVEGSILHRQRIFGESVTLDCSQYPTGIYFVVVQMPGEVATCKLVKSP